MKRKIVILVVILLVSSSFISKKLAEEVVMEYMEQVNNKIGVEVDIHKIWSKVKMGQVEVYVEYTANNYLRLVSKYKVVKGQVVHSERVSQ